MASTYTSNLGIEQPASGDRANTWGTMVNANMGILDRTVSGARGTLTVPSAGMPVGGWNYATTPQTLNLAPTSLGDGHYAALTVTDAGDLGYDVYLQVTPGTASRSISFRNSLSGARNLIVYQGTYNASYAHTVANGYDATLVIPGDNGGSAIAPVLNKPALTSAHTATLIDLIYPVGSIYIAAIATNPGTLFGVGTWESFGSEKMLRGISTGTAGTTGGADSFTLVEANIPEHNHDFSAAPTLPDHVHAAGTNQVANAYPFEYTSVDVGFSGGSYRAWIRSGGNDQFSVTGNSGNPTTSPSINVSGTTGNYGQLSPTAIDNRPAYITVYMWKRIA